jgi:hypothetical protein
MSGETEREPSGLSVDNLHNLLRASLDEMDRRLTTEIQAIASALTTRLNAIDKATDKFEANLVRVPTDVDKQVGQLKELVNEKFLVSQGVHDSLVREITALRQLHDEKFASVSQRFDERKEAADEQNRSNTLAISKSEAGVADTLNKQADLFRTTTDALGARIDANKEEAGKLDTRLTAIESRGVGIRDTQSDSTRLVNTTLAALAILISLGTVVLLLVRGA